MDEPDERDASNHEAADDDVPRPVDLREEGAGDVVRHEQRRQRDHDQVVEEQHPAGDEPPEVVERDADERGGAAGLADRRRPLRVRERDDEEEHAGGEQDERRKAQRVERDDAQGEVDRRRDLPVGDREQRRSVEDPLQAGQLSRH